MSSNQPTAGGVAPGTAPGGRAGLPRIGPVRRWPAFTGTIRGTILVACLAIALLTGLLGLYAISAIRGAGALVAETFDQSLISISYAREAGGEIGAMDMATLRLRLEKDPARQLLLRQSIQEAAVALAEDLKIAVARSRSPHAAAAAAEVQATVDTWRDLLRDAPHDPLTPAEAQRIDQTIDRADEQIEVLTELAAGEAFRQRELAVAMVGRFTRATIAGTLAALALSAGITWLLARRIIGPVAAASGAAGRIAGGDMHAVIPAGGSDELGRLLRSMAIMRDSIRTMMEREVAQRRSAQSRLLDAVENSSEGVILVAPNGRIGLVNTQALHLLKPLAELLQPEQAFDALLEPARRGGMFLATGRAPGGGDPADWLKTDWSGENDVALADGKWLRVSRSITSDGGSIAILTDITTLKAYQDALEQANLRFAAALNNMSQGLCLFDQQDRLQVLNDRFREIYRLPKGTPPLGIGFRRLVELRVASNPPGTQGGTMQGATQIYQDHAALIDRRQPATIYEETSDGRTIAISHVPMEAGGWVATFEDITAHRRSLAQIQFILRHDGLTGLGNRTKFMEQLALALAQTPPDRRVAALHLDLDHFKTLNNTLGQAVGDQLLQAVGKHLLACHGDGETVFRLAVDEFAIIQTGIGRPEEAAALARQIIATIRRGLRVAGRDLALGISIGIAVAPEDGRTAELLAEHAGMARDRVKADERGSFRFFEPGMNARVQERRSFEQDLRRALAEEELEVFFQPLVDLKKQRVTGFEALLRWQHPRRGLIAPADFIPLAEELGLIVQIGEWVLRRACHVAAGWSGGVKVAVNVSPIQFKSPQLVAAVADALAVSGLAPERLELEITETALLASSDATVATLQSLKRLGAQIAMDDFGTGYSSLSYLRSFPFDKIKIDQSFIRDLKAGDNSRAIIDAICAMARSLGMRTVAEGVETAEQLEIVRTAGCAEVQGYLIGKPCDGEAVPELVASWELEAALP